MKFSPFLLALLAPSLLAEAPKSESKRSTGLELAERVETKRIDFPETADPKTTLAESLAHLQRLSSVSIEVNDMAFKFENEVGVLKTEIANPNLIPAIKEGTIATVLRNFLARIPVRSGATYLIREDSIEVTTGLFVWLELGRDADLDVPTPILNPLPLVYSQFDKRPLEDTLQFLADCSGCTIVLDPTVGEKSKMPISVRLKNVPLETTLRLLAEMTDLRLVQIDNVSFMTSAEKALRLEKEEAQRQTASKPIAPR